MDLLNKEVNIDVGHLILLAILIIGVVFFVKRCRLLCGSGSGTEDLQVPLATFSQCRCQSCSDACYQRALDGQLPGCGGCGETNYDQCNDSYRRCLLSGCDVAAGGKVVDNPSY